MKKVMILWEHHGQVVLDVSTTELHEAAALSVVKGRFGGNNPYYPLEQPREPRKPEYTAEEIIRFPASLQGQAQEKLEEYTRCHDNYRRYKAQIDQIRVCIDTNDGRLAVRILQARKGYEDEGFEIMEVHESYPSH